MKKPILPFLAAVSLLVSCAGYPVTVGYPTPLGTVTLTLGSASIPSVPVVQAPVSVPVVLAPVSVQLPSSVTVAATATTPEIKVAVVQSPAVSKIVLAVPSPK